MGVGVEPVRGTEVIEKLLAQKKRSRTDARNSCVVDGRFKVCIVQDLSRSLGLAGSV
jgi:hypothetical protein